MEAKKKASKNVWIYQEDYDFIGTSVKYGKKFADGLNIICNKLRERIKLRKEQKQLETKPKEGEQ